MTAAGILSHSMAGAGSITRPMSASTPNASGAASTTSGSAGISANDFLTLLVTEMQNQDPTAATDPNEYINQLVQVNSLEQLININQTLSGALGTTTATDSSASGGVTQDVSKAESPLDTPGPAPAGNSNSQNLNTAVTGNLGIPPENAAANRVAHALGAPAAPAALIALR